MPGADETKSEEAAKGLPRKLVSQFELTLPPLFDDVHQMTSIGENVYLILQAEDDCSYINELRLDGALSKVTNQIIHKIEGYTLRGMAAVSTYQFYLTDWKSNCLLLTSDFTKFSVLKSKSRKSELNHPYGIAFKNDEIYIADNKNRRVEVTTSTGEMTREFRHQYFLMPRYVTVRNDKKVCVTDCNGLKIYNDDATIFSSIDIHDALGVSCDQNGKTYVCAGSEVRVYGENLEVMGRLTKNDGIVDPLQVEVLPNGHIIIVDRVEYTPDKIMIKIFWVDHKYETPKEEKIELETKELETTKEESTEQVTTKVETPKPEPTEQNKTKLETKKAPKNTLVQPSFRF